MRGRPACTRAEYGRVPHRKDRTARGEPARSDDRGAFLSRRSFLDGQVLQPARAEHQHKQTPARRAGPARVTGSLNARGCPCGLRGRGRVCQTHRERESTRGWESGQGAQSRPLLQAANMSSGRCPQCGTPCEIRPGMKHCLHCAMMSDIMQPVRPAPASYRSRETDQPGNRGHANPTQRNDHERQIEDDDARAMAMASSIRSYEEEEEAAKRQRSD